MKYICILAVIIMFVSCKKEDTILFKDDFENHTLGKTPGAPWKKTGNGTVIIDDSNSFSGNQAVHFTTGEGYQNRGFIGVDHIFPLSENKYYGVLKMYVKEASPDGVHWTMIQSSGKVNGADFSSEIRYGGQHSKKLMANYETQGVQSDCWQHADIKIPEKQWFTLHWFFDGDQDTMKLWVNTTLIESIVVVGEGEGCVSDGTKGKWEFPVFENILIGWVDYQTGGGIRELWIDDVMLSESSFF